MDFRLKTFFKNRFNKYINKIANIFGATFPVVKNDGEANELYFSATINLDLGPGAVAFWKVTKFIFVNCRSRPEFDQRRDGYTYIQAVAHDMIINKAIYTT